jgi:signal transduction histidine kinase
VEDITERKRAEEALQVSQGRLGAAAALAGLGFYETDHAEGVVFVDERLRDLCGVPPERSGGLEAGAFWREHVHPDDLPGVLELQARLHGGLVERVSTVYRYEHPTRGLRWIHHLADSRARDAAGRATRTYGVMRDVTEEKRAEASLKELSRRLLEAHEAERSLLARELHDDLSQRLALLAIEAGRTERASAGGRAEKALCSIRQGLVRLSEDVHALAYQLHPSVLEELGLAEALRTECERRRRQGGPEIALSTDEPADVGPEAALCLFRVAQEALNNVARHAEARTVTVDLRRMDGGLLLAIRDDGVGFDPAAPRTGHSLGLASMRERVRLVRGSLDVESAPGEGTAVVAWVPGQSEPA